MDTIRKIQHASDDIKSECKNNHEKVLGVRDAIEILSGKWKIGIIAVLTFHGKMRFMDLLRVVDGIAAKMLSKELQDLEAHQLITRTVLNTKPITVEYEMTAHGLTMKNMINSIAEWGYAHRKKIMKGEEVDSATFEKQRFLPKAM